MNEYSLPHAIGEMPEFMRNWTYAIANKLDVDVGMALATLISGMATAVHGLKIAERPDGGFETLSIFSFVLADPTTGKTRTHKLVHAKHNVQDAHRYKAYTQAKQAHKLNETELAARLRWVILKDTTNRGLLEALDGIGGATAISVHEGQTALNSVPFRRHLDTLNVLFDGEDTATLVRANGDCVAAIDASLCVLVMVQHDIFGSYCGKFGAYARGIGFFSRCLFTRVSSHRVPLNQSFTHLDNCLDDYYQKVESFLNSQLTKLEAGTDGREVIKFSEEAKNLYTELLNKHQYLTSTSYWHIQDAANRSMQNVIRIAAIIHCFSGAGGDIPAGTLQAAYAIVQWHMGQFSEIFPPKPLVLPPPPKLTTRERAWERKSQSLLDDRQAILGIIADQCLQNREASVLKSEVTTLFREHAYDARFRAALLRLVKSGEVLETGDGKKARLSIVSKPQNNLVMPPPLWPAQYSSSV